MLQSMWFWAASGLIAGLVVSIVPGVGVFVLAPLAAVVIGVMAAWYMRAPDGSAGRPTRAAMVAGVGAFLASIIALTGFGWLLGSNPAIQELVRESEPHPEARVPYEWMAGFGMATGALVGFGMGLFNFALSTVAGLLTTLFTGHKPSASSASARAAGG
jgi:hypothetical protein